MEARFRSWWQQIKQHPYITGIVVLNVVFLAFILFILSAYRFGWDWTGFTGGENKVTTTMITPGTATTTTPRATVATEQQPAKTLWDWLGLFAVLTIPAVVGLGAAWFTVQQGKESDRENTDNQREKALQAYIDKMSELLLEKKLRDSAEEDEVRKIARVRTLTILARLDPNRKRSVLQFLYESKLIEKDKCIADLYEANLRDADLRELNLNGANLSRIALSRANLHYSDLSGANVSRSGLIGANLSRALLREANLHKANLTGANLSEAILDGADLSEATMTGANLKGASITTKQLAQAILLMGAILPDGSLHN